MALVKQRAVKVGRLRRDGRAHYYFDLNVPFGRLQNEKNLGSRCVGFIVGRMRQRHRHINERLRQRHRYRQQRGENGGGKPMPHRIEQTQRMAALAMSAEKQEEWESKICGCASEEAPNQLTANEMMQVLSPSTRTQALATVTAKTVTACVKRIYTGN